MYLSIRNYEIVKPIICFPVSGRFPLSFGTGGKLVTARVLRAK